MGLNISVLTPLGGPPSALPVAVVATEGAPTPAKVAPSAGSGQSGLEAGLQQGKPRAGGDLRSKNRSDTVAAEQHSAEPQSHAQMGEMLRVSIAPKGAEQASAERGLGERIAAERHENDQPDYAKALAERVMLLPEKGDLSLEASRLPPYGERAGEEDAVPSALRRV